MKPRGAVLGVDPGTQGGIAVVRADGWPAFVREFRPGMTREDLNLVVLLAVRALREEGGDYAFLEKVNSRPGEGHKGAFTFGRVYGLLEGALVAHGVRVKDVYPMMWQTRLECLTGGNKAVSRRKAEQIFPWVRPMTNYVADALLIAEYGRRCVNPASGCDEGKPSRCAGCPKCAGLA